MQKNIKNLVSPSTITFTVEERRNGPRSEKPQTGKREKVITKSFDLPKSNNQLKRRPDTGSDSRKPVRDSLAVKQKRSEEFANRTLRRVTGKSEAETGSKRRKEDDLVRAKTSESDADGKAKPGRPESEKNERRKSGARSKAENELSVSRSFVIRDGCGYLNRIEKKDRIQPNGASLEQSQRQSKSGKTWNMNIPPSKDKVVGVKSKQNHSRSDVTVNAFKDKKKKDSTSHSDRCREMVAEALASSAKTLANRSKIAKAESKKSEKKPSKVKANDRLSTASSYRLSRCNLNDDQSPEKRSDVSFSTDISVSTFIIDDNHLNDLDLMNQSSCCSEFTNEDSTPTGEPYVDRQIVKWDHVPDEGKIGEEDSRVGGGEISKWIENQKKKSEDEISLQSSVDLLNILLMSYMQESNDTVRERIPRGMLLNLLERIRKKEERKRESPEARRSIGIGPNKKRQKSVKKARKEFGLKVYRKCTRRCGKSAKEVSKLWPDGSKESLESTKTSSVKCNVGRRKSEPVSLKGFIWRTQNQNKTETDRSSLGHMNCDEVEDFALWEQVPVCTASSWELSLYKVKRPWSVLSLAAFNNNRSGTPGEVLKMLRSGENCKERKSPELLHENVHPAQKTPNGASFDVEPSIYQKNIDIRNWLNGLKLSDSDSGKVSQEFSGKTGWRKSEQTWSACFSKSQHVPPFDAGSCGRKRKKQRKGLVKTVQSLQGENAYRSLLARNRTFLGPVEVEPKEKRSGIEFPLWMIKRDRIKKIESLLKVLRDDQKTEPGSGVDRVDVIEDSSCSLLWKIFSIAVGFLVIIIASFLTGNMNTSSGSPVSEWSPPGWLE